MEELSEVSAMIDTGLEGCAHAGPASKRQVLQCQMLSFIERKLDMAPEGNSGLPPTRPFPSDEWALDQHVAVR
jgi:hypothetical protein